MRKGAKSGRTEKFWKSASLLSVGELHVTHFCVCYRQPVSFLSRVPRPLLKKHIIVQQMTNLIKMLDGVQILVYLHQAMTTKRTLHSQTLTYISHLFANLLTS